MLLVCVWILVIIPALLLFFVFGQNNRTDEDQYAGENVSWQGSKVVEI